MDAAAFFWIIGGAYALSVLSFGFTAWVFRYAMIRFEKIMENHIDHLEKRLTRLENR